MRITEHRKNETHLTALYAAVQASFWMTFCIYTSFAAAYLKDLGYTNTGVGAVMALGNLSSAFLAPALSAYIDREEHVTPVRIIPLLLLLQGASFLVMGLLPEKGIRMSLAFICCIGFSFTVNPMNVKLYVDFTHRGRQIDFGFARGCGSLAYVVLASVLGVVTGRLSTRVLPWAGLLLTVLQVLTHIRLCGGGNLSAVGTVSAEERHPGEQAAPAGSGPLAFLASHRRYSVMLAGIALLFFAHNIVMNFMINVAEHLGGGTADVGFLNAFMAAVEIPVMMFFVRWFGKRDMKRMLTLSFFVFTIKAAAIAFAPSMPFLYASFLLQAPSFALYTAAIVPYVDRTIPYADAAKAQSFAVSMTTVGAVFASIFGGFLYDHTSVFYTLLAGCGISAAGTVLACYGLGKERVDT